MSEAVRDSLKAVFYTDGGCKPNPGFAGWGVFGYLYTEDKPKQGSGAKGFFPTHKGYQLNETKETYGDMEVTITEYIEGVGAIYPRSTNNEAELMALLECLRYIEERQITEAVILIDSLYTISWYTQNLEKAAAARWTRSDGSVVPNRDILKQMLEVKLRLERASVKIEILKVDGHSGELGNDIADELASKGIILGRSKYSHQTVIASESIASFVTHAAKGYWSTNNDIHKFFGHNRWVFVNGATPETYKGLNLYYTGELGKQVEDSLYGKAMTDASFGCVLVKEKIPILEQMRQHHTVNAKDGVGGVVIVRMDNLLKPSTFKDFVTRGSSFVQKHYAKNIFSDYQDNPLSVEMRPSGLSFRAIDEYALLFNILKDHLSGQSTNLVATDVTDYFVIHESKGKKIEVKLKKEIDSSLKHMDVKVNYAKAGVPTEDTLRLLIGTDTLKRNSIANMVSKDFKILVLTWPESETSYRYATVVESGGEYGIWAAVYANLKFIKPL